MTRSHSAGRAPQRAGAVSALALLLAVPPSFAQVVDDFETGPFSLACVDGTCSAFPAVGPGHGLAAQRSLWLTAGKTPCSVGLGSSVADDAMFATGTAWTVDLEWNPPGNVDLTSGGVYDRIRIRLTTTDSVDVVASLHEGDFTPPVIAGGTTLGDFEILLQDWAGTGIDVTDVAKVGLSLRPRNLTTAVLTQVSDVRLARAGGEFVSWDVVQGLFDWCPGCPPEWGAVSARIAGAVGDYEMRIIPDDVVPPDPIVNIRMEAFDDGGAVGSYGASAGHAAYWEGGDYSRSTFDFVMELAPTNGVTPTIPSPPVLTVVAPATIAVSCVVRVDDAGTGALLGSSLQTMVWDVFPGQPLEIAAASVTPIEPALARRTATAAYRVSFTLKDTGDVDEGEPLFSTLLVGDWAAGSTPTAVPGSARGSGERDGISARPSITRSGTTLVLARPRAEAGVVTIYDVGGAAVRTLPVPAGAGSVTWDGRGERGRLPSGVYFAALRGERTTATTRVILLR